MKKHTCFVMALVLMLGVAGAEPSPTVFYTQSLSVTITPQAAADAGAQWKISGLSDWKNSGDAVGVPEGDYVVIFSDVNGWARQYNTSYTVPLNIHRSVTAEYADYPQRFHIIYHNPNSDVQPQIYNDHIHIPVSAGPGYLKILPVAGTDGSMDIIDLQVEGSLLVLLSGLNMNNVRVTGDLKKAIFRNAHAVDLKAHNLGTLRMLDKAPGKSSSYGEENHISIDSGNPVILYAAPPPASDPGDAPGGMPPLIDPDLFACNINLVGVSLLEFSAASQIVSLSVSPKVYRWVRESDSHIFRDLSLGRIPNTGLDREAGRFTRILAYGGLDAADSDSEAIGGKSYHSYNNGPSTMIISRAFSFVYQHINPDAPGCSISENILIDGSIYLDDFRCRSDHLKIYVMGGNLFAECILNAGEINTLAAKRGRIALSEAISGFYSSYPTPHIRKVIGDEGVNAWFIAGFDGNPTHAGLMGLVQCLPGYDIVGRAYVERDTITVRGDPTAKGVDFLVFTE